MLDLISLYFEFTIMRVMIPGPDLHKILVLLV